MLGMLVILIKSNSVPFLGDVFFGPVGFLDFKVNFFLSGFLLSGLMLTPLAPI